MQTCCDRLQLTCVSHGAEDALGDGHDGVGGLVVASDGLPSGRVLADVLQQVLQGLAHHAGSGAHLPQQGDSHQAKFQSFVVFI